MLSNRLWSRVLSYEEKLLKSLIFYFLFLTLFSGSALSQSEVDSHSDHFFLCWFGYGFTGADPWFILQSFVII